MEKTTDEKIMELQSDTVKKLYELQSACMLLQEQITALRTLINDLYKNKEDKRKLITTLKKN